MLPPLKRLEDGYLAGDVEVVDAGAQAGFDERLGGIFEGPGAAQHDRDIFQRAVDPGGIGRKSLFGRGLFEINAATTLAASLTEFDVSTSDSPIDLACTYLAAAQFVVDDSARGDHQLFGFSHDDRQCDRILKTPDEVDVWLSAETKDALELQKPLPDGAPKIVARGERSDGKDLALDVADAGSAS